jgi:hypothetical protein
VRCANRFAAATVRTPKPKNSRHSWHKKNNCFSTFRAFYPITQLDKYTHADFVIAAARQVIVEAASEPLSFQEFAATH